MTKVSGKIVGVALIGYGTVGAALARLLMEESELLNKKSGARLVLRYIIDRDPASIAIDDDTVVRGADYHLVINDQQVAIVIELIGGTDDAYGMCQQALKAGKHVVTANKALLAEYGEELLSLARQNNVCVAYEASCGGGIPILRALYSGLIGNRIDAIFAIINGTCNYVLSEMTHNHLSYQEAIAQAQKLGYAESDPTLDVNGTDAAHKLSLITTLAFGINLDWRAIDTSGIDTIDTIDIHYGNLLGYQLKLVAMSMRLPKGIVSSVGVAFLPQNHPLRWVEGSFNAVSVYGHATGHTLFYGKGAGGDPTASAVVADLVGIATGEIPQAFMHFSHWPDRCPTHRPLSTTMLRRRYYLRIMVHDSPGTLARIYAIFGKYSLNIAAVHQEEPPSESAETRLVPVIVTLHRALEKNVNHALAEIEKLSNNYVIIPILDEHNE